MKKLFNILFAISILFSGKIYLYGQEAADSPVEIYFSHEGDQMHGWFYQATGKGPFSTVVLLHGSVGQDGDIFNLGKNLSSEGYNVMTYNYPGSWRSGGLRTDESALASVNSAMNYVKSASTIQSFQIDTAQIFLMGYSYGGGMALLGSVNNPIVKSIITIAGTDLSIIANRLEQDSAYRKSFENMVDNLLQNPVMIRGTSGADYVGALLENKESYDLKKYSEALYAKKMLFIVGWLDYDAIIEDHMLPLYRELKSNGADHLKMVGLATNHSMAGAQKEMTSTILEWLRSEK